MIPSWKDPETQDLWTLIASEIALLPGMTDKIGSVSPSSLSLCKCMVGFRNATTGSTHRLPKGWPRNPAPRRMRCSYESNGRQG